MKLIPKIMLISQCHNNFCQNNCKTYDLNINKKKFLSVLILVITKEDKENTDNIDLCYEYTIDNISIDSIDQRGPTTGPRNNFVQAAATFFFKERYDFGTKKELRSSIPVEDLFFFREHPDFGTKIGVFSRLRPANSNNFEKWPTRVQKLDHPGIDNIK